MKKKIFLTIFLFLSCLLGLTSCKSSAAGCKLSLDVNYESVSFSISFTGKAKEASAYTVEISDAADVVSTNDFSIETTSGTIGNLLDDTTYKFSVYVENALLKSTSFKTTKLEQYNGLKFEDKEFTYDGNTHSLAVEGLPANANVTYSNNDKVNPGAYEVTATVVIPGYKTTTLSASLKINKATLTSDFVSQSIPYDGNIHKLEVSNLPEGATVTYENNEAVNVGTYNASALIKRDGYEDLTLTATLTITKADFDVKFVSKTAVYDGASHTVEVSEVPEGTTVTYENNSFVDAGSYQAKAVLSNPNYNDLELTASLTIEKALYTESIGFNDTTVTYDGASHALEASKLPEGAVVNYTTNSFVDAGVYEVTATITHKNYLDITAKAKLTINKATMNVVFEDDIVSYDGASHSLLATNVLEGASVSYTANSFVDAGEYDVTVTVKLNNYVDFIKTAKLYISPIKMTAKLEANTFTYDGASHGLVVTEYQEGAAISYNNNDKVDAGEYTVTATITLKNYETLELTNTLTITKAKLNCTLTSNSFTYDGKPHTIEVANLPDGAEVIYENNVETNIGEYHVSALVTLKNYDDLFLEATLTITPVPNVLESNTFTYDGQPHKVEVVEPTGTVTYPDGNEFTNAGVYTVRAVVTNSNGEIVNLSSTLTIEKATMTGVKFNSLTVDYDALEHEIVVSGAKEGSTITYNVSNKATDVTSKEVTATITNPNYKDLELTATLTINAVALPGSYSFTNDSIPYDGNVHSLTLNGYDSTSGITVTYKNNEAKLPGTYYVEAVLSKANYNDLTVKGVLIITALDFSNLEFKSLEFKYDGTSHSLEVKNAPTGATIDYTNNGKSEIGTYTVEAKISMEGYNTVTLTAELTITKAAVNVTFEDQEFTYDGKSHSLVAIVNTTFNYEITYENNGKVEAGEYTVVAHITSTNNQFEDKNVTAKLTIKPAKMNVTFENESVKYDGASHSIYVKNFPSLAKTTYENNGKTEPGVYTVKVTVTCPNYVTEELTATLTIYKEFECTFENSTVTYDGATHSLVLVNAPQGAKITYQNNDKIIPGSYTVTATVELENYKTAEYTAELTINKAEFTAELNDFLFTYDGEAKSLVVTGAPLGTTITYNGNGQTEVGTYLVSAELSHPYYNDKTLNATMTIKNNTFNCTMADITVDYDGATHSTVVANVPDGATVSYENNDKVLPGVYVVKATISKEGYDDDVVNATLTINALKFTATLTAASFDYTGSVIALAVEGAPLGTTINYSNNENILPGTYTVEATLTKTGYETKILTADLTIKALEFVVVYEDSTVNYDGASHGLTALVEPDDAKITYSDNSYTLPGEYDVTVTITKTGYTTFTDTKKLTIQKIDMNVKFEDDIKIYTGDVIQLLATGYPEGATVVYGNNSNTDIGEYTVTVTIEHPGYNKYVASAKLSIIAATMADVDAEDFITTYDGSAKYITVTGVPTGATITYKTYLNGEEQLYAVTPGEYHQVATVSMKGYTDVVVEADVLIEKGEFTTVVMEDKSFEYDGENHTLTVTGLPAGAVLQAWKYCVKDKLKDETSDGRIEIGEYVVKVTVHHEYYNNKDLEAKMIIHSTAVTLSTTKTEFVGYMNTNLKTYPTFTVEDIYDSLEFAVKNHSYSMPKDEITLLFYNTNEDGTIDDSDFSLTAPTKAGNYYVEVYSEAFASGNSQYDESNSVYVKLEVKKIEYTIVIQDELSFYIGSNFNYFGSSANDAKYTYSVDLKKVNTEGTYDLTITRPTDDVYLEANKTIKVTLTIPTKAIDLFISEFGVVTDGKYVIIYNGTGEDVNLSNYKMGEMANGKTTSYNGTYQFEDVTLKNGESIALVSKQVLADNMPSNVKTILLINNSVLTFGGNDTLELIKDGKVIDIAGKNGESSNLPFGEINLSATGIFRRISNILYPVANEIGSNKYEWNENEWIYLNSNDYGQYVYDLSAPKYITLTSKDIKDINATKPNEMFNRYVAYAPKIQKYDKDMNLTTSNAAGKYYKGYPKTTVTVDGNEIVFDALLIEYTIYNDETINAKVEGSSSQTITYDGKDHKVTFTAASCFKVTYNEETKTSTLVDGKHTLVYTVKNAGKYVFEIVGAPLADEYNKVKDTTKTITVNAISTTVTATLDGKSFTANTSLPAGINHVLKVESPASFKIGDDVAALNETTNKYELVLNVKNADSYSYNVELDSNYTTKSTTTLAFKLTKSNPVVSIKLNDTALTTDTKNITYVEAGNVVEITTAYDIILTTKVNDIEVALTDGKYSITNVGDYMFEITSAATDNNNAYSKTFMITIDKVTATPVVTIDGYDLTGDDYSSSQSHELVVTLPFEFKVTDENLDEYSSLKQSDNLYSFTKTYDTKGTFEFIIEPVNTAINAIATGKDTFEFTIADVLLDQHYGVNVNNNAYAEVDGKMSVTYSEAGTVVEFTNDSSCAFTVKVNDVVTALTDGKLTLTNVGTYTILVESAATSLYKAFSETYTVAITPKNLDVLVMVTDASNNKYDFTKDIVTGTYTVTVTCAEALTLSADERFTEDLDEEGVNYVYTASVTATFEFTVVLEGIPADNYTPCLKNVLAAGNSDVTGTKVTITLKDASSAVTFDFSDKKYTTKNMLSTYCSNSDNLTSISVDGTLQSSNTKNGIAYGTGKSESTITITFDKKVKSFKLYFSEWKSGEAVTITCGSIVLSNKTGDFVLENNNYDSNIITISNKRAYLQKIEVEFE